MNKILFIRSNEWEGAYFLKLKKFLQICSINEYEIDDINLEKFSGIYLSSYLDQYKFKKSAFKIRKFLENGGRIFHNGHITIPFFDELKEFEPIVDIKLKDFFITKICDHEIYKNVDIKRLNSKKGVAGFYSRGQNPPPKNAKIITAIKNATVPVDWELKIGDGYFYTHAGIELHACAPTLLGNVKLLENIMNYLSLKRSEDE